MHDSPPSGSTPRDDLAVLLFDGDCALCNRSARFVAKHDRSRRIQLAKLRSRAAAALLARHGVTHEQLPDSLVLVDAAGVHVRSDAALSLAALLDWPWKLATIARVLPGTLRDAAYDAVATRRYRWFGTHDEACPIDPALREELTARMLPEP